MIATGVTYSVWYAMPPEFGRNWGTECLNTRFPLPTLLCAGYSVKLIYFIIKVTPLRSQISLLILSKNQQINYLKCIEVSSKTCSQRLDSTELK